MSTVPYAIYNSAGNELTSGLSEYDYAKVAQRLANEMGETVYAAQGSGKEEAFAPVSEVSE